MAPKSAAGSTRRVSRNSFDKPASKQVTSGDISSLHQLLARFEEELSVLRQRKMGASESQHIDDATRRLRMISLLEEFSVLSKHETAFAPDLQEAATEVFARLLRSLTNDDPNLKSDASSSPFEPWRQRKDRHETPADFIMRVYKDEVGRLTLADIRSRDFPLYNSLMVWKSRGNQLPAELKLPTRSQVVDKLLEERGFAADRPDDEAAAAIRLYRAQQSRLQRRRSPRPS